MLFDNSPLPADFDYERFCREFKWEVPEDFNFGFDVVDKRGLEDRTKLALVTVSERGERAVYQSFYELSMLSNQLANALHAQGLKKGDACLIILQNVPEWYVVMIALCKLGVVAIPGTVLLTAKDIAYRIGRAEANMIITDQDHVERAEGAASECPALRYKVCVDGQAPGWLNYQELLSQGSPFLERGQLPALSSRDPLLVYFTSGTTGQPKMALHTHSYPLAQYMSARYVQTLRPTDLHWTVTENGWAKAAWGKLFGQFTAGAAVLQQENPGRFDPEAVMAIIQRYGVTTFCAPPTVYRMLIQLDLSQYEHVHLRHCLSAGEPLNPEVIRAWKQAFNCDIYDYYGQSETISVLGNTPHFPLRLGAVGKPVPGFQVHIVDHEGRQLPPHQEGVIAVSLHNGHPAGLLQEYWKDEKETAASFHDNYYYTGDKAYMDEDGYFWFVGRADDIIKSSGYRIGPFEVESSLIEHPAVAECAVVGVEDPEGVRGVLVKAFIVLARGHEPSDELTKELQEHVKNTTAPYKYPRLVEYLPQLPKTVSGKILRRELRKRG